MSSVSDDPSPDIRRYRTKWRETVLICRKCTRKVKGGFGCKGRESLRDELKDVLRAGKGRSASVGLVEVGCFKLCPKKAVTVALGLRPGELLAVPAGMDVGDVAAALGLDPGTASPGSEATGERMVPPSGEETG